MSAEDIKLKMLKSMPLDYRNSYEGVNIIERESEQFQKLDEATKDLLNQFVPDRATWGLVHWERICGIPTDETKPYDQRRSVIKSKLRGIGIVTVEMIKNVAESYQYGEVDVTQNYSVYEVVITFIGKLGVPPNLDDIKNALREIMPAHLDIRYVFTYVTYAQYKEKYATYADMKATGKTYAELIVT